MVEKLDDLKKKSPCPSCCQNLKVFQAKVKFLEEKNAKNENLREDIWYECVALRSKNQELLDENFELRGQIRDVSWKPTQRQIDIEKIRNPMLGNILHDTYSHVHSISGLGLPQKHTKHLK